MAEGVGGYGSTILEEEQKYQDEVIDPRIMQSFEIMWAESKEFKKQQVKERKLAKLQDTQQGTSNLN